MCGGNLLLLGDDVTEIFSFPARREQLAIRIRHLGSVGQFENLLTVLFSAGNVQQYIVVIFRIWGKLMRRRTATSPLVIR